MGATKKRKNLKMEQTEDKQPKNAGSSDYMDETKKRSQKEQREEIKEKKRAAAKETGKVWLQKYPENTCTKRSELQKEVERLTKENDELSSDLVDKKSAIEVKNMLITEQRKQLAEHKVKLQKRETMAHPTPTKSTSVPGQLMRC